MRWLLVSLVLASLSLSGCLAELRDDTAAGRGDGTPPTASPEELAATLGTLYMLTDGQNAWLAEDDSAAGATSQDMTLTLSAAQPSTTISFPLQPALDRDIKTLGTAIVYADFSSTSIGANGQLTMRATLLLDGEPVDTSAPSGDNTASLQIPDAIASGTEIELQLTFESNVLGAQTVELRLQGESWLQVPGPAGDSRGFVRGAVTVTMQGSRFVAERTDIMVVSGGQTDAAKLHLQTVNGEVAVEADSETSEPVVTAELRAWGNSENTARERLDTLWVEAQRKSGAGPLDYSAIVRTTDTSQNRWSDKAGSLHMRLAPGAVREATLDTTNGNVEWHGIHAASLSLDTTNGGIDILDASTNDLRADTTNGQIVAHLDAPRSSGEYTLDSTNGEITLHMVRPADHGVDVRGDTTNGDVRFSFAGTEPVGEQDDNDKHVRSSNYDSAAIRTDISLDTTNGDITASDEA